jgi:hypothetical protein
MPLICCLGNKNKSQSKKVCAYSPRSAFRERLPEHIKSLTVDVTYTKTEVQPKCVPSPKDRRFVHYESDSDSDNDVIASFSPNFGCSKS